MYDDCAPPNSTPPVATPVSLTGSSAASLLGVLVPGSTGAAPGLTFNLNGISALLNAGSVAAIPSTVVLSGVQAFAVISLADTPITPQFAGLRGVRAINGLGYFGGVPTVPQSTIDARPSPSPSQQDDATPGKIDKSVLTISEPRRLRDKAHLKFVGSQPCLICARSPADAHHLRFAQPRAMGRKVSDEFTVPLCRTHHRDNHSSGDEVAWWERRAIDPLVTARMLWISTRRIE